MQKIIRYRKAFYEKENDFQTGNTKPHTANKCDENFPYQLTPKRRQLREKNNSELFCQLYANQALREHTSQHHKTLFLANHKIDALLRARMLDWMVEVTSSYRFSEKGYFDSVQLMDRYFQKQTISLPSSQLHIIGVTCMLIASKISELNPLKIKTVFEKIAHRKLPLNDILSTEASIVHKLEYRLNSFSFYDLACFKLAACFYSSRKIQNKIDRNITDPCNEQTLEKALSIVSYLSKLALFDYEFYCQKSTLLLAECIAKTAWELAQLDSVYLEFENTPVDLQMCRIQLFKGIRRFKHSFKGLNNVFKYTNKEVMKLVENCLE